MQYRFIHIVIGNYFYKILIHMKVEIQNRQHLPLNSPQG